MRQAGRYLPEYINTKNQAGGFMSLIRNPELACEVTLQPLRRYPLDSAILFSDILVVADMFNMNLRFEDKIGPIFDKPLRTEADFEKLPTLITNQDFGFSKSAGSQFCHIAPFFGQLPCFLSPIIVLDGARVFTYPSLSN